jgi:hypothetical protein
MSLSEIIDDYLNRERYKSCEENILNNKVEGNLNL